MFFDLSSFYQRDFCAPDLKIDKRRRLPQKTLAFHATTVPFPSEELNKFLFFRVCLEKCFIELMGIVCKNGGGMLQLKVHFFRVWVNFWTFSDRDLFLWKVYGTRLVQINFGV